MPEQFSKQLIEATGKVSLLVGKLSHLPQELLEVPEIIATEDIARVTRALTELTEVNKNLLIRTGISPSIFKRGK